MLTTLALLLTPRSRADGIQSLIPSAKLVQIKAALPQVSYPTLSAIFSSSDTLWYDTDVMKPSYQETGHPGGGAQDNAHWLRLIASPLLDIANKIYDAQALHWRFPFAATAGTDNATNIYTANFLSLPSEAGKIQPIPVSSTSDDEFTSWVWRYPNGTVIGEVLFIKDGTTGLLPCEVRTRTRSDNGWSANVFRPFPEAADLDLAIKINRPQWQTNPKLVAVVQSLENNLSLTPLALTATGLPGTFDQSGFLDTIPDFGDDDLVRGLLQSTEFISAYGTVWKQNGDQKTYAASTQSSLSIVPQGYTAGMIEVSDSSCMRCHQSASEKLEDFYSEIQLYGEIWGKDGIFTFHPFDESYYQDLDLNAQDNRHMNQALINMGVTVWKGDQSGAKSTGHL